MWINPVTNRTKDSKTTARDMNRIVGNIIHLGGTPIKTSYSNNDIVKLSEWTYIVNFAKNYISTVTMSTLWSNLNLLEQALLYAHEELYYYPSNSLYPSDTLIIHGIGGL